MTKEMQFDDRANNSDNYYNFLIEILTEMLAANILHFAALAGSRPYDLFMEQEIEDLEQLHQFFSYLTNIIFVPLCQC